MISKLLGESTIHKKINREVGIEKQIQHVCYCLVDIWQFVAVVQKRAQLWLDLINVLG